MSYNVAAKIRYIATGVRRWAEDFQKKDPANYEHDLCGLCAIASARLFNELKAKGFEPQIAVNESHAFIICNGYLVDVTATQFTGDGAKVVVKKYRHIAEKYWQIKRLFKTLNGLKSHQERTDWEQPQRINNPNAAIFPATKVKKIARSATAQSTLALKQTMVAS